MASGDGAVNRLPDSGERIDISRIKLMLTSEGFDDASIGAIIVACRKLGFDLFSLSAIYQVAAMTAVTMLCGYDIDFSGSFGAKDKQPLTQAVSAAFKKIRDDNQIDIVPKKGKYARHGNARDLVAKLLEKREDVAIICDVTNDRIEKMPMEKVEDLPPAPEEIPEAGAGQEGPSGASWARGKPGRIYDPGASRSGCDLPCDPLTPVAAEEGRNESAGAEPPGEGIPAMKISIPAEIVIGKPAIVNLQNAIMKNMEVVVASMLERMKPDIFDCIAEMINTRSIKPPPVPERQEPAEKDDSIPEIEFTAKPRIHLVVVDLNHLYIFAKNVQLYYSTAWFESIMKKIYTNMTKTADKIGAPFIASDVIGKMFLSKKYAFLERHIEEFCIGSADEGLRSFPSRFVPWNVVSGTKFHKGHEIELDVDTWVVKEVDIEILKRHRGEIVTLHIVSGDKDMIPAVETAREEGIHVVVMSYKRAMAMELASRADAVQYLD